MPRLARIPPNPQLLPVNTVTPGHLGINLQQEASVLPPDWATEAQNAIIDPSNRVAARLGNTTVTTTPVSGTPAVKTLFEQNTAAGGSTTIISYNGGISTSVTDPAGSDISGSVTDTNGSWHFANFNDKVIGFQSGQKIIVRSTGNFATVSESSGTAPTGGVGTAAYGRVWQVAADGHTIMYSGLLNETQWNSGGAGQIDMQNIWTQGTDVITAIVAFNYNLLVFGLKHVVFLGSANQSALGLDVSTLGVTDVIEGTGCITQHSVQHIGSTDLLFLAPTGVQSIGRLLVQRSRPVATLTKYVRDTFIGQLQTETPDNIRSVYSPTFGFYLISFPNSGYTWVLDQRRRFQDPDGDDVSPITRWTIAPTAMYETVGRLLYFSGVAGGTVGQYNGNTDNGSAFQFKFQTPWLDLGTEYGSRLKILKRLGSIIFLRSTVQVTFKYYTDFSITARQATAQGVGGTSAEWGIAEWNNSEWSGGALLQLLHIPAFATGQFFRFSIEASVSSDFAIQQTEIFAKIGRIA